MMKAICGWRKIQCALIGGIVAMFPMSVCDAESGLPSPKKEIVVNKQAVIRHLHDHLVMLTRTIGERSVRHPDNLDRSAAYIQATFESVGLSVHRQTYTYNDHHFSNIIANRQPSADAAVHYVLGAHYDSVSGTVGADDNASGVAVMLETARAMQAAAGSGAGNLALTYVAFALEEPPAYGTKYMGSRVFASSARQAGQTIDGMICLEMVGFTCHEPGCQHFPFPLQFLGYPDTGTFIGMVSNLKSLGLARRLRTSFRRNPNLPLETVTVPFNGWIMPAVRLSDHASFWSNGYRAVMLTDSAYFRNTNYHLSSDTMETLDFNFMAELVVSLAGFFSSTHPDEPHR
jgi:hypothetical protein